MRGLTKLATRAVLAKTKDNVDAPPTVLGTYEPSAEFARCTIWQVARATSAATTFFKSIKLGRLDMEFIDAGFGNNNPCDVLLGEARQLFPDATTFQILSIGTGLGRVVTIKGRRSILDALAKMVASSTKVALDMDRHFADSGQYFRFNVDNGLQDITLSDWEKTSKIVAHTHNYLLTPAVARKITECASRLIAATVWRHNTVAEDTVAGEGAPQGHLRAVETDGNPASRPPTAPGLGSVE